MFAGERELYQRFAAYDDEELLRILTVERAHYRGEALTAAENVLMRRGVAPPTFFPAPAPPAPQAQGQPKGPYQFVHFAFDVVLLALVCWAIGELWAWTIATPWGLWAQLAFYVMTLQLLASAAALRGRWRAKEW